MSGFGTGFSFGTTTTTASSTTGFGTQNTVSFMPQTQAAFGSAAPAFGSAPAAPAAAPAFGASAPAFNSTGISFGNTANATFGAPATTTASNTGLFSLGTNTFGSTNTSTALNQNTQQSGFSFNFNQPATTKPAVTTAVAAPSFFSAATTTAPSTSTNFGNSSFSFNLNNAAATTSTTKPATAVPFGVTSNSTPAQPAFAASTTLGASALPVSTQVPNSTLNTNKTTSGFSLNFGTSTSTIAPIATSLTTTAVSLSTTTSIVKPASTAPVTTTATTTQSQPSQPTQMTFKQLEGYINVWLNELNQMESDFQTQSLTINSWDSLLVNNGLKITSVNESLDLLKEEYKRIDQQLDFVISQQNELEQLLEPLEKIQVDFNVNDTATTEREFTYSLVETVSNDLHSIGSELQNFIKKLNETKANQDINDPLSSFSKVLNSHIDALQYIEHQINVLKRNVEV